MHLLALFAVTAQLAVAPGTPALFTLEHGKEGCAAVLRPLPSGPPRTLWTAKLCADHVLFDAAGKRAIVVKAGGVRARGFDGSVRELGTLGTGDVMELWLESSGALRATTLEIDPKGLRLPDDGSLPPWGTPARATLWQLEEAPGRLATWQRLETKPTKAEAGDVPGVTVLTTPRAPKPGTASVRALLAAATCVGGAARCDVEAPALLKLVGATDDATAGTLAVDATHTLVFRVVTGDTPHAFAPVVSCTHAAGIDVAKSGCGQPLVVVPKSDDRQLGLSVSGGYVLVAEEYTGADPRVLDAAGKTVLAVPLVQAAASAVLVDGATAAGW